MKKALMMILLCLAMISFAFPRDIFEIANDGTPEEMKAAIETGADVNIRVKKYGDTLLHKAAVYNIRPEMIKVLINAGLDVNSRDISGRTPLHEAAGFNDNPSILKVLIEAGADIDAKDNIGWTPLHLAASIAYVADTILVLIKSGANPKTRDPGGKTPWECIQDNEALINTKAYWALNDARYE